MHRMVVFPKINTQLIIVMVIACLYSCKTETGIASDPMTDRFRNDNVCEWVDEIKLAQALGLKEGFTKVEPITRGKKQVFYICKYSSSQGTLTIRMTTLDSLSQANRMLEESYKKMIEPGKKNVFTEIDRDENSQILYREETERPVIRKYVIRKRIKNEHAINIEWLNTAANSKKEYKAELIEIMQMVSE